MSNNAERQSANNRLQGILQNKTQFPQLIFCEEKQARNRRGPRIERALGNLSGNCDVWILFNLDSNPCREQNPKHIIINIYEMVGKTEYSLDSL